MPPQVGRYMTDFVCHEARLIVKSTPANTIARRREKPNEVGPCETKTSPPPKPSPMMGEEPKASGTRLPFFYGWVLVAIALVTMAVGVNARTAFSVLFPAILDEFGWDRGITAGAF
jgi:hypothetical protein